MTASAGGISASSVAFLFFALTDFNRSAALQSLLFFLRLYFVVFLTHRETIDILLTTSTTAMKRMRYFLPTNRPPPALQRPPAERRRV
jgi:hypothetical protein